MKKVLTDPAQAIGRRIQEIKSQDGLAVALHLDDESVLLVWIEHNWTNSTLRTGDPLDDLSDHSLVALGIATTEALEAKAAAAARRRLEAKNAAETYS